MKSLTLSVLLGLGNLNCQSGIPGINDSLLQFDPRTFPSIIIANAVREIVTTTMLVRIKRWGKLMGMIL